MGLLRALEWLGLTASYPAVAALHGISLALGPGTLAILIGGRGAAKSAPTGSICGTKAMPRRSRSLGSNV